MRARSNNRILTSTPTRSPPITTIRVFQVEVATDSGCQEPLMAGSPNAIALVPMDRSGYDSSEPAAMDLVHARRQTGLGLPPVGAARHHLSHALAAPNRAGRGPG